MYEGCIEQMQRLFATKMYGPRGVVADGNRLIRMDDHEPTRPFRPPSRRSGPKVTPDNFHALGTLPGCVPGFPLQLNGFGLPGWTTGNR